MEETIIGISEEKWSMLKTPYMKKKLQGRVLILEINDALDMIENFNEESNYSSDKNLINAWKDVYFGGSYPEFDHFILVENTPNGIYYANRDNKAFKRLNNYSLINN
ncbi:MAG: hypothetical protein ACYDDE_00780 [bacterium]